MNSIPSNIQNINNSENKHYKIKTTKIGNSFRIDLVTANDEIQERLNAYKLKAEQKLKELNLLGKFSNIKDKDNNESDLISESDNHLSEEMAENNIILDNTEHNLNFDYDDFGNSDNNFEKNLNLETKDISSNDEVQNQLESILIPNNMAMSINSETNNTLNANSSEISNEISNLTTIESTKKTLKNIELKLDGLNNDSDESEANIDLKEFNSLQDKNTKIVNESIKLTVNKVQKSDNYSISVEDYNKISQLSQFDNSRINIENKSKIIENSEILKENDEANIVNLNNNVNDNSNNGLQNQMNNNSDFDKLSTSIFGEKLNEIITEKNVLNAKPIKSDVEYSSFTKIYDNIKLNEIPKVTANIARNLNIGESSSARLLLQPKSLGTVFVELHMNGDVLKINFKTEKDSVKHIIENQMYILKDKLQNQGIKIENIDVRNYEQDATNYNNNTDNFKKDDAQKDKLKFVKSGDIGSQVNATLDIQDEQPTAKKTYLTPGSRIEKYI